MPKPSLTIFALNKVGGLTFYYTNLVRTGAFRDFETRYLVTDVAEEKDARLLSPLEGAPMELVRRREAENFSHVLRRVAARLPSEAGLVLTNSPLELACLDVHRRRDLTVVHVCHDEYYLDVALWHAHAIDAFVAHNPYFAEQLRARLPPERAKDVTFLPFGIRQDPLAHRAPNPDRPLEVVFIGRFHHRKGVMDLPWVDDLLRARGVTVKWTLLGRGPEQENLERATAGRDNFTIESPPDGAAMLRRAARGDVFVLPTRLDGTPLAVMEAMSVGLVPVVSEFNPGARWMVPAEAGFVGPREPGAIAETLTRLHKNRAELEERSAAALRYGRTEFDVDAKARGYAEFFARWRELKTVGSAPARRYGSVLDKPWVPNVATQGARRVLQRIRAARRGERASGR